MELVRRQMAKVGEADGFDPDDFADPPVAQHDFAIVAECCVCAAQLGVLFPFGQGLAQRTGVDQVAARTHAVRGGGPSPVTITPAPTPGATRRTSPSGGPCATSTAGAPSTCTWPRSGITRRTARRTGPVIGCASYRGYYRRSAAEREAERLADKGLDVTLEPVPAYSTLGWFDDPVLNTVIGLDNLQDPANAGTVFRCAAAFGIDADPVVADRAHLGGVDALALHHFTRCARQAPPPATTALRPVASFPSPPPTVASSARTT